MDTKAAFEKFMLDEMDLDVSVFRNEDPETSENWPYATTNAASSAVITVSFKAWCKAWTASRAAIEIPSSSDSEYWFEGTFQRMRYERDVEKAITSHGIRIKGKAE